MEFNYYSNANYIKLIISSPSDKKLFSEKFKFIYQECKDYFIGTFLSNVPKFKYDQYNVFGNHIHFMTFAMVD